jgi:ParB family chromosome partitioning protein
MQTNEWYTRPKYIEAAREVMGSIELDPASCTAANEIVKAERYYTKEQNGLLQEWKARSLWLNPPYARTAHYQSGIGLFVQKCLEAYHHGDVQQAIILATNEANATWFQPLLQFLFCIPDHRVKFLAPEKHPRGVYQHMFGTVFVYLGPCEARFTAVFSQFGHVVKTIKAPSPKPASKTLWIESAGVP